MGKHSDHGSRIPEKGHEGLVPEEGLLSDDDLQAEVPTETISEDPSLVLQLFTDRLFTTLQGISLAVGTSAGLHLVVPFSGSDHWSSAVERVGLGLVAGATLTLVGKRLNQAFEGRSFKTLWHSGDRTTALARACVSSLGIAAFWSGPVFWAQGAYSDFSRNQQTLSEMQGYRETVQGWREDPASLPSVEEIAVQFHEEVIRSTGAEGQMTPQALAKMALFFDGLNVQWSPDIPQSLLEEREGVTIFEDRGKIWRIQILNPASWLVVGETESWWISADADGEGTSSTFGAAFPEDRQMADLRVLLNVSGKLDGETAIDDLVTQTGELPALHPDFVPQRNWTAAFLPAEINQYWRQKVLVQGQEGFQAWLTTTDAQVKTAADELFGTAALEDESSYGNLSAMIQ